MSSPDRTVKRCDGCDVFTTNPLKHNLRNRCKAVKAKRFNRKG